MRLQERGGFSISGILRRRREDDFAQRWLTRQRAVDRAEVNDTALFEIRKAAQVDFDHLDSVWDCVEQQHVGL